MAPSLRSFKITELSSETLNVIFTQKAQLKAVSDGSELLGLYLGSIQPSAKTYHYFSEGYIISFLNSY